MRKSRLAGMTEAELDDLAFEIDECQTAKGKPLSMTRWRTRIGNRVREVQEESGLGERPERYSPAWLYMLYAREALAEADRHDADELPFRLYEIYGEKFQQPFAEKDAAPAAPAPANAEPTDQPPTGDQPSEGNEPQPQSTEPPTTEASDLPSTAPTEQSPAKPPTTDPVPPPVTSVTDVPVVPIVSAVPETADEPPQSASQSDEPPPDADSTDSAAPEVDWSAF